MYLMMHNTINKQKALHCNGKIRKESRRRHQFILNKHFILSVKPTCGEMMIWSYFKAFFGRHQVGFESFSKNSGS